MEIQDYTAEEVERRERPEKRKKAKWADLLILIWLYIVCLRLSTSEWTRELSIKGEIVGMEKGYKVGYRGGMAWVKERKGRFGVMAVIWELW